MSTIRTGVLLTLNNRFSGGLRQAAGDVSGFSAKAGTAFGHLNRTVGGLAGRFAALGGGFSLAVAAKGVIDMEAKMTRLGTQASMTAEEVKELQNRMFEVSMAPDIKVNPDELYDATSAIVEFSGNAQFAQENMETLGMAIQATGASGKDVGSTAAELEKLGMNSEEVRQIIEALVAQGKMGAFTFENFAKLGPRILNAYTATGRDAFSAVIEAGAAMQVVRRGTGSAEQAATAFEALMATLTDPKKIEQIHEMGVDIYDEMDGFRPITDIMNELITKGKDLRVLGLNFDREAMRALIAGLSEFNNTGGLSSFEKFMDVQADGSVLMEDSARNASTMAANLTNLRTAFRKFAEDNLSEPIQKVADALNAATPEDFDRWASGAKKLALGLIAVKGLAVVGSAVSAVNGVMAARRGGKGRGVLGSMGAGMGGAMPVYVTNWGGASSVLGGRGGTAGGAVMRHTGAGGGTLAALKASARSGGVRGIVARKMFAPAVKVSAAAARSGALGGALRTAGKAAKVLGKGTVGIPLAMSAIEIASIARNRQLDKDERTRRIGGAAGGAAGAIGGMALGAALGSVVPVIGTAIGGAIGLVGGALGAHFGRKGGEAFGEQINKARDIRAGSVTGQMSPYFAGYASRSLQLEQVKTAAPPPEVNLTTNVSIEESADGFTIETEVYRGGERIAAETGYQARSFVP